MRGMPRSMDRTIQIWNSLSSHARLGLRYAAELLTQMPQSLELRSCESTCSIRFAHDPDIQKLEPSSFSVSMCVLSHALA